MFLFVALLLITGSTTEKEGVSVGTNLGDRAKAIDVQRQSVNGKYVLIQFWAAYNPESRFQNVLLNNKLQQINRKDIQMISISFDDKVSVFEETVKADKLNPSTQFHNSGGKNSLIYETYHLDKGFTNILLDPHGVIIAKDIKPENLENVLKNFL